MTVPLNQNFSQQTSINSQQMEVIESQAFKHYVAWYVIAPALDVIISGLVIAILLFKPPLGIGLLPILGPPLYNVFARGVEVLSNNLKPSEKQWIIDKLKQEILSNQKDTALANQVIV